MKKKSIIGKLALSPLYILKGVWEWSGQMEDELEVDMKVTCKYCGNTSNSIHYLCVGTCAKHPLGKWNGHHVPMR